MPDRDNATNESLYVSATEPATVSDKRLPASYTRVGLIKQDATSIGINMIDGNDKDSGKGTTSIPGRASGNTNVTVNRNPTGDAGALIIRNAAKNRGLLWFLRSSNVVGEQAAWFNAYVSNYTETSNDQSPREASFTVDQQDEVEFFEIQT